VGLCQPLVGPFSAGQSAGELQFVGQASCRLDQLLHRHIFLVSGLSNPAKSTLIAQYPVLYTFLIAPSRQKPSNSASQIFFACKSLFSSLKNCHKSLFFEFGKLL